MIDILLLSDFERKLIVGLCMVAPMALLALAFYLAGKDL